MGCKRDPECPFVVRCNWERRGGREPLARVTVLRERHSCLDGVVSGGLGVGAGVRTQGNGNGGWDGGMGLGMGSNGNGNGNSGAMGMPSGLVVGNSENENGHIIPGARVIQRHNGGTNNGLPIPGQVIPVLPKVQRNSASRLPFLMGILPKLMTITRETTPVEIRDCLMREFGAEVHLQQCRRAKTEILKKAGSGDETGGGGGGLGNDRTVQGSGGGGVGGSGSGNLNGGTNGENNNNKNNNHTGMGIQTTNRSNNIPQPQSQSQNQIIFSELINQTPGNNDNDIDTSIKNTQSTNQGGNRVEAPISQHPIPRTGISGSPQFTLQHSAQVIVVPPPPLQPQPPSLRDRGGNGNGNVNESVLLQSQSQSQSQLGANANVNPILVTHEKVQSEHVEQVQSGGAERLGYVERVEQPIRCPYCINVRWMRSVRDAVEHMSMHVVV